METDNDFFEQLRKQSEQLSATPQAQTWQRLELHLKKAKKQNKRVNFLSFSFFNISILAIILIVSISVLAYIQYQNTLRKEQSFLFFTNFQKHSGIWKSEANATHEEIFINSVSQNRISFSKIIFFKTDTIQKIYFSLERKLNKNVLTENEKTFSEKKVLPNEIFFESGAEKINILLDEKKHRIVFIYPERSTTVYTQ